MGWISGPGKGRMTERLVEPAVMSRAARQWGRFVLFEGCTMSRRMTGSRYAARYVLDKYGFDYVMLDSEKCCGSPVRRSGGYNDADNLRNGNLDIVQRKKVQSMVTACPGCGSQLKCDVAEERGIRLHHLMEVLYTLAKNGELYLPDRMREIPKLRVTAHYPCHLHRGMNVECETMHRVFVEALPNLEWVPLPDADKCCGAGGGVRASQKDLSFAIRAKKLKQVERIGADIVLAACPFCELQIDEGLREAEDLDTDARAITPQSFLMMMFKGLDEEVKAL